MCQNVLVITLQLTHMFHVMHADREMKGNVVIRGTDKHILVVLVANAAKVENNLWFDTGLDHNNSHQY